MHNIELQPVHLSNTNDSPMGHALQSRAKEPIMVEVCLFWLRLSLPSYYQLVDLLISKNQHIETQKHVHKLNTPRKTNM